VREPEREREREPEREREIDSTSSRDQGGAGFSRLEIDPKLLDGWCKTEACVLDPLPSDPVILFLKQALFERKVLFHRHLLMMTRTRSVSLPADERSVASEPETAELWEMQSPHPARLSLVL
jgi:hypothetical protein